MKPAPLTNDAVYRLFLCWELCRSTGVKEFPGQLAAVFFWIASHNGCLQQDLERHCSLSASSVSRNVDWLGSLNRRGEQGLGFVRREKDVIDGKRWRLFLTPKGKQFVHLLELQLKPNTQPKPNYDNNDD